MKTKLIFLIMIVSIISLTGCTTYSKEEKALLAFIQEFYDVQYDAYSNLEYMDIEPYSDMNRIQNKNKVIALKKVIIQREYMEEMKYCYVDRVKHPIKVIINDININDNYAALKIDVELDEHRTYPKFISSGKNNFVLKMVNDTWKIVNHDYEGLIMFETSNKELLPEIDEERIRRVIDNEYVSPFS